MLDVQFSKDRRDVAFFNLSEFAFIIGIDFILRCFDFGFDKRSALTSDALSAIALLGRMFGVVFWLIYIKNKSIAYL